MHRTLVTAAAALALSATAARADWAYTHWGMTPEQVAQASGGAVHVIPEAERRTITEADLQTGAEGTYADGAVKLQVKFGFDTNTGGLSCVIYAVQDAAQGDALKEAMIKRYGQPENTSGLPAIGMTEVSWSKPDDISLTQSTGERAFVIHCANPPQ